MTRSRALLSLLAAFLLVVLALLGAASYVYLRWNPAPPLRQAFVVSRGRSCARGSAAGGSVDIVDTLDSLLILIKR